MNYLCVGHDFGVINMRSQAYITEACQPWNLSYSEYVTLMTLYDFDGSSQSELCNEMKADKALVARSLKTLEEKGYVCRRQKDGDRRFKFIYLTPKARDIQGELAGFLETWITYLVEGFDETKRDEMLTMLHAIAERADEADIRAVKEKGEMTR
ncbi:MarR family transcriptional regulator [Megasphaera sp.]|uniref:MarR family winged helix-turn-helix transcriptional regulator n=1 Tax=Megasphaera sp. TaxID=2023260 RepID=UPI00258A83F6|nr:MarR family transcriptional regulator [Megasphaera sp.]